MRKLSLLVLALLSGCWLFEVADLTHPIEDANYWARCEVYLSESIKPDRARTKASMDPHNRAWLDCIERQRSEARSENDSR